jgi:hypothetical protein
MPIIQSIPDFQSMKLIFRGSDQGFLADRFHALCDNIKPTLSIIKAHNGAVFGLFTDLPWKSEGFE